ncbi:MAG: hypothetical protein WA970_22565 [Gammaproteobacteria bacterium]
MSRVSDSGISGAKHRTLTAVSSPNPIEVAGETKQRSAVGEGTVLEHAGGGAIFAPDARPDLQGPLPESAFATADVDFNHAVAVTAPYLSFQRQLNTA